MPLTAAAESAKKPPLFRPAASRPGAAEFAHIMADLSCRAMLKEADLTPKPGLVDRDNNGAHQDMCLADFHRSAHAIRAELPAFTQVGMKCAALPPPASLPLLRPIGIAAEQAMLAATNGVNTHKGAIFSLGLLNAAAGRLWARGQPLTPAALCRTVAGLCSGIVARELAANPYAPGLLSAGLILYRQLGLSGARGQAEAGWPLVLNYALPAYRAVRAAGAAEDCALLNALLLLMAHNDDTNLAARGGLSGLKWAQARAQNLLSRGGVQSAADYPALHEFNRQCIIRNLSPGGSADLLIITWLLAHLPPAAATDNQT